MKKHLSLLASATLLATGALGQSSTAPLKNPFGFKSYYNTPARWAWVDRPWTANETPYRQARKSIEVLIHASKLTDAGLAQYRQAAFARPNNSVIRFRWAYYAYGLALMQPDQGVGSNKLAGVVDMFWDAPPTNSYQYARLRYLVYAYTMVTDAYSGPAMLRLGERLLRRDPKDGRVKYLQVTRLLNTNNVKEFARNKDRALLYAQQMVRAQPNEPAYHSLLGYVYETRWAETHNKADAQAAIDHYNRYIALGKLTGSTRTRVEFSIKRLQSS